MNPAQPHNFFSKKNLPASDIEAGKLLLIDGLILIYRGLSRKVRFFTRLLQGHLVWLWCGSGMANGATQTMRPRAPGRLPTFRSV